MAWIRLRPRSRRSSCSTASISGARGASPPAHQLPATSLVVEDANEPGLARPTPAKQHFGCGVVDDPAVTGVKASLRDRDDIAKRSHAVLQRSPLAAHSSRAGCGAHRLPVCPHVRRDRQPAAGADPSPIRHSLPRPSPAASNEPSTNQTATQSRSSRRQSRSSSATGIPVL